MLENLKEELVQLHLELPKNHLVAWTGGNISARDDESNFVVIKPSGIRYEDLQPEHMVVLNLQGEIIEGDLKPSSDTYSHLYTIERQRVLVALCILTPGMRPLLRLWENPFLWC